MRPQNETPLIDRNVSKSINMSDTYASSFGSGAVEHIQNWFDQCRKLDRNTSTRQPLVLEYDSEQFADLVTVHRLKPNITVVVVLDSSASHALGILVACDSAAPAGKQLLLLKNYASRITLDDLILGVSSKQGDNLLAGLISTALSSIVKCLQLCTCTLAPSLQTPHSLPACETASRLSD